MKVRPLLFLPAFALLIMQACHSPAGRGRAIAIQPFLDFPPGFSKEFFNELRQIDSNVVLKKPIPLPLASYNPQRGRYRADSIINFLDHFGSRDTVVIGLTEQDISTTKGSIQDWGVMGLGFEPGNACVVSAYRLNKANLSSQFYKVVLHELGHTQGLPHCENTICLMRDAEGGNHLEDEICFCASCKAFLQNKGWQLN